MKAPAPGLLPLLLCLGCNAAVLDTRGLQATGQPFGLELSYNEGVNSSATAQDTVLVQGFIEHLATAIIALVGGVPHSSGGPVRSTP